MNNETNSALTPIGLYRDKESGTTIGAIDENQAAAFIHIGFEKVDDDPYTKTSAKELREQDDAPKTSPNEGATDFLVEETKAKTPKDQTIKGTK